MPQLFVIVPVTDMDRAKDFYTAIGFTVNPLFTDHNAACMIVEEDHSYFMLETREFLQSMSELPLGDPAVSPTGLTTIYLESREAVDTAVRNGMAAGGASLGDAADYGFMYQHGLTDPDGNILDFGWMDPLAARIGPEAFAKQQG